MTATDRSTTAAAVATPTPDAEVDEESYQPAPRWPAVVGLVLTVAGLAAASYLTYAHYTSVKNLSCPEGKFINCAKVTTSSYSHIFGMPVAVLGLAFFLFMLPLQLPVAWRSTWRPLRVVRLGSTVVGVGMILWLLYVELFKLDSICLYCSAVHIVTVLLFITTALGTVSTSIYADD